ncbi:hypothetical protein C8Q74DRAFT_1026026 [Fomes fomentarius]|nr:hypothetical protein C8Q74DRAFT_1026026 [Fomes fomentarius]
MYIDPATMATLKIQLPVSNLYLLHVTKCTTVAASTLAALEIIATFSDEVAFIWPGRWSIMKVIFLVNKYSVLLDTTLATTSVLYTEDPRHCEVQFQALAYTYIVGTLLSELILLARTLALWNYHVYVKILIAGGLIELVPVVVYAVYQALVYTEYPSNDVLKIMGCVPGTQDSDAWPAYACLILGETTIVVLTIIKRYTSDSDFESASNGTGRLIHTMYRDGSFFYAIVLAVSIMNLLMMLLAPPELISSTQMPLRVVHSALCTRVLLNLRKAAAETCTMGTTDVARQTNLALPPETISQSSWDSDTDSGGLPSYYKDGAWDQVRTRHTMLPTLLLPAETDQEADERT